MKELRDRCLALECYENVHLYCWLLIAFHLVKKSEVQKSEILAMEDCILKINQLNLIPHSKAGHKDSFDVLTTAMSY